MNAIINAEIAAITEGCTVNVLGITYVVEAVRPNSAAVTAMNGCDKCAALRRPKGGKHYFLNFNSQTGDHTRPFKF